MGNVRYCYNFKAKVAGNYEGRTVKSISVCGPRGEIYRDDLEYPLMCGVPRYDPKANATKFDVCFLSTRHFPFESVTWYDNLSAKVEVSPESAEPLNPLSWQIEDRELPSEGVVCRP